MPKYVLVFAAMVAVALLILTVEFASAEEADNEPKAVRIALRPQSQCIPEEEQWENVATAQAYHFDWKGIPSVTLFADPMGNGGTHAPGQFVTNYVDLSPAGGSILEYECGDITYDGHNGIDIAIIDWHQMDEGIPVLCAAPGVVIERADGHFDRCTSGFSPCCGPANRVIVQHADGSVAWYYHLKKGSVTVSLGEIVAVGDTLGMIGSSGCSTGPHLHFEVRNGAAVVDPSTGACNAGASWWQSQHDYALDQTFDLHSHVLVKRDIEEAGFFENWPSPTHITAPGVLRAWVLPSNFYPGDTLKWEVFQNSVLWSTRVMASGDFYYLSLWVQAWTLPTSSLTYGNWEVRLYHNSVLLQSHNFTYNSTPNQAPVALDSTFEIPNPYSDAHVKREFACSDPDGSPFWYVVQDGPSNGTLIQDGGRRRKFTYIPNLGFSGEDTVLYYAIDDDSVAGPVGEYVFVVHPDWYPDSDNDGYGRTVDGVRAASAPPGHVAGWGDCNDNNAAINPGATEVCDGLDNDCDMLVDVDAVVTPTWYYDGDGDGYGVTSNSASQCIQPIPYAALPGDCNDNNSAVHPGVVEICDGVDNDCNAMIDDNAIPTNWFADTDEDGYGDNTDAVSNCGPLAGRVADSTDCDDSNPAIHPGADELCNGLDNNCNGTIGDNAVDAPTWYGDADGDGYGTPFVSLTQCDQPTGYVASFLDCNDNNAAMNPGEAEVCDGLDNDCNGTVDVNAVDVPTWYLDSDLDGYGENSITLTGCAQPNGFAAAGGDCDDGNEFVNPGVAETCGNFTDDNCDGNTDEGCCACDCHADPVCDAVINNVQDVVVTINVAFRGAAAVPDPNSACPAEATDVNCDTFTSVVDVVKVVNVAFRGANAVTEYCDPCP